MIFPTKGKGGPYSLSKYIYEGIKKWNKNISLSKRVKIIHKEFMRLNTIKNVLQEKNTYIWFERSDYIFLVKEKKYDNIFRRIIYGPIVTPLHWFNIPKNNTYEIYWCKVMEKISFFVTHSKRVKNHIISHTKCYSYIKKYIILNPCIEYNFNTLQLNSYYQRNIDFLIYIKYADSRRKLEENILIDYLKHKYIIEIIKYGNHTKKSLILLANKSKYVIYFSFYDTGALSLLEMKLMGVWPISHQEEFIEIGYGSIIKELDTNITRSLLKLDDIYNIKYDPKNLSNNVINNLNCVNSLYNVIKKIR